MKLIHKLLSCFTTPTAAQNAAIELANAERDLLESQTGREFADAMVKYNEARIARLKRYTQDFAKAENEWCDRYPDINCHTTLHTETCK